MSMNRFLILGMLTGLLAACANDAPRGNWYSQYGANTDVGTPAHMQYGISPDDVNMAGARRMAVLLPLSGDFAPTGRAIRSAIEIAVLQNAPNNLSVSFYDAAADDGASQIQTALAANPEIIIGPVFSGTTNALRVAKPETLPVLSFTSDAAAVGDGVMTMALMPTNSVEAIVKEIANDGAKRFIIMAPDTASGRIMAGTAKRAADVYNVGLSGLFYYDEKNTDSIKNATMAATMNSARVAANNRAREILSDILTNERLTAIEKSNLNQQLEKLSKNDTLGALPYDAVLFLGTGDDTKSLASFLRYYGLSARDARFYGTAVWDGSDITSDVTMIGAKFATLPESNSEFAAVYENVSGALPARIATFGYDAANMAIGMIYSDKSNGEYLLNPSGYVGIDGLIRLRPSGENERALRIVQIDGTDTLREVAAAKTDFMSPIYSISQHHISPARAMDLETPGINPTDYINIPERLRAKYKSKSYGVHQTVALVVIAPVETILPEDDSDVVATPDFTPVTTEKVSRTFIDSVEIEE